ncbi:DEAD/DEAH box helicase [Planobispora siamensis]|uniref:Helicase HelZ n=1 Tax=Planobispora siamensis TaxID=936338 RepID=A0A8J3SDR5_9ACTN|nr:DEAD/DEAH box helicase [Planobispora siamensis]GIH90670.1 helicase HelZ [Planobispora siamensis]
MLVVHGAWVDGKLGLWAEDTARGPVPVSRATSRPHPFATPAHLLASALFPTGGPGPLPTAADNHPAADDGRTALAATAGADRAAELVLLLPGSAKGPSPSPESGLSATARKPRILPWRVPALLLPPAEALRLLDEVLTLQPGGSVADPELTSPPQPGDAGTGPDPDLTLQSGDTATGPGLPVFPGALGGGFGQAPRWIPGLSLRYLAVVAEHARSLVRRGRILPQLTVEHGVHAARWRPVLTGDDRAAFRALAAAMPPVCRAAGEERPSAEVLREALDGLADGAARSSLPDRLITGPRPGTKTALPDRWLHALTGEDASLPAARPAEAAELGRALDGWFAAAHELDGPVRACFRLIEPAGDDDLWRVEFGLAPSGAFPARPHGPEAGTRHRPPSSGAAPSGARETDSGTHHLPASSGVPASGPQEAGAEAPYLSADRIRSGERAAWLPERPLELLRAELGRAVRLHPDLHLALRDPEPSGLTVETAWAFSFLRHGAPVLRAAGYGVLLPAWAGRQGLGLKLTARMTGDDPGAGLEGAVSVRVEVAIGDHTIGEEELAELAARRIPLVRIGDRWVELDDVQLKAAMRAVGRRGGGETTVGQVIREIVEGGDEELPLVGVDADGFLGDLFSGEADRRLTPVATPDAFRGTLRPYQERGLSWLSFLSRLGLGGVLADDMGLGKTAQTLSLLLAERTAGGPPPTLLVCPMSLIGNWRKEAARFAPSLRVYVHHGGARMRGEELAAAVREADLVITTYGTALRDLGALARLEWDRVVCDEAQAIKNSAALQSRAVRSIPARTRLALTGTPVENHLAELWSIMEFCNPGLLGPAKRFHLRYREPIETRGDEDATRALKRATGPFVLRRLKTDRSIISDLPEKLEMKVWCTLTPEQAELYRAVVDDMLVKIDGSEGIERHGNVMATMTRLKQICNHPAHLLKDGSPLAGRSGKLARLEEIAAEVVEEGDKALVFTQYAEFGSLLAPYLAAHLDRPVLWLHGGLSRSRREALVERFQNDDEPMLFLLSLKAAGTGLNLTAANHVIHVDRWWNPAVEEQATDRAFRIGQTRNVQVRKFICVDTLEERIDEMIERKRSLAESVVGTGEDWISDLSTERLRELFTLGPGAVS